MVINTPIESLILLSALFLLSSPSSPQASSGTMSETLKVQVVSNLIVMPGYVNDSSRLEVVLDTGAAANVLMPDRASELKLDSASSGQASGLGRGQDESMRFFSGVWLAWGDKKRLTLNDQLWRTPGWLDSSAPIGVTAAI